VGGVNRLQVLREVLCDVDLLVSTALVLALVMGVFALAMMAGGQG